MKVFNPGESAMADKGFLINNLLSGGVQLVRPPFLGNPQFTAAQAKNSKDISEAQIHVERAIGREYLFAGLASLTRNFSALTLIR